MTEERKRYLQHIETCGAETGWVSPLTEEDKEFFRYFRMMCRRYNIVSAKATQMEYDFVTTVAESEFYLQRTSDPQLDPL